MTKFEIFVNWIVKHTKIVMPIVLAVCVIITVAISVNANKREAEKLEDVTANSTLDVTAGVAEGNIPVPEIPLKENDNPEIAQFINEYYEAQVNGDVDTVRKLTYDMDEMKIMRIEEMSKYIEAYPTLDIYYKDGPKENTYIVFVCSYVKFIDYDEPVPGMKAYYICQREDGSYYDNCSEDGDEYEVNYIREVSLQDDAVDLNNKVVAAYNNMFAESEELRQLTSYITEEIDKNVGEALAKAEAEADTDGDGTGSDGETQTDENQEPQTVVTKVKATDVVNIRSSDSETADKLGKAALGEEFDLIEKIENGWSKVAYNGGEAYIKSEYLEDIETTELAAGDSNNGETSTDNNQSSSDLTTTGTVTVTENVRIRSGASETSEKIATAYTGEKLEVIMKQADGWTKIKYKGKIAYVKSDYVQ